MSLRDISSPAELELLNDLDGAVTPKISPRQSQDSGKAPNGGEVAADDDGDGPDDGKLHMKKQLGLLEGCAIILGIIFGSGKTIKPEIQSVN